MRYFLFFFLLISRLAWAQQDTLKQADSIVIMDEHKENKIIEDITEYSKRDNIFGLLLNNVIKHPGKKIDQWEYSYKQYDEYVDKVIRNVSINTMEVFGQKGSDTARDPNMIEKLGDFLHVKTREWIIRNQLLFSSGQRLAPFKLAESERLLRSRNYLYDAQIRVIPVGKDSADIIVTTQDLWSLAPGGAVYLDEKSGKLTLNENNFLGYGFKTRVGFYFGDRFPGNDLHYDGAIRFENLFAQYLHVSLIRDYDRFGVSHKIEAQRIFETPLINYAGGIIINWHDRNLLFAERDSILLQNMHFHSQEYWFGYGTSLFNKYTFQNEYYIGAAVKNWNYVNTTTSFLNNVYFQDNTRFLTSAGYAFRRFHKTRFVVGLGRTEDIPVGSIFTATAGYVDGKIRHKWYAGAKIGYSTYAKKIGYFSVIAEAGSFFYKQQANESAIRFDITYFTNLQRIGNFRMRHFARLRHAYIDEPQQLQEMVQLDNNEGIRGFNLDFYGNKKLVFNYELNLFPPIKLLGFGFAGVAFVDFGLLANENEKIWNGRLFRGVGLGLKVRNENLIFQSIQLLIGYFPDAIATTPDINVFGQERDFYEFDKYRFSKPEIVRF